MAMNLNYVHTSFVCFDSRRPQTHVHIGVITLASPGQKHPVWISSWTNNLEREYIIGSNGSFYEYDITNWRAPSLRGIRRLLIGIDSSLGATITAVVPTLCIKRSFPMQSGASLTNLSTLFEEMLAYRVFKNACYARMQCGPTAVMTGKQWLPD